MIQKRLIKLIKYINFLEREKQKIRNHGFGSHDG